MTTEYKSDSARRVYKKHMETLSAEESQLVDQIFSWAESNYGNGGDSIVECWTPAEILDSFKNLDDAKEYCRVIKDRREDIQGY